jgi:iron complex outermembrane receptor protein
MKSAGVSGQVGGKINKWYYKINATYMEYADYKVPADSIQYYSYTISIKKTSSTQYRRKRPECGLHWVIGENFRPTY